LYEGSELVSIIISVFNDGNVLEKNLENLIKLKYPNYEILVVYSTKSTDRTEEIALQYASRYPQVRAIPESISRTNAMNLGIDQARSEFLLFLDSDSFIYDGFLERALSYFSVPDIICVQALPLSLNSGENLVTRLYWALSTYLSFINAGENKYFHGVHFSGYGGIWRKKALIECGKFALDNPNEDFEINLRICTKFPKYKGVFDDRLYCYEYSSTSYTAFYLQQVRWGIGNIIYKLKGVRSIRQMNWGQKFVYLASFLLGSVFPIILWISMGMNFVQFFANFFHPNINFGGGLFLLLLGALCLVISFIIMFIFAYRAYYRNPHAKSSLSFIIVGVLGIIYLLGLVLALISLNTVKLIVQKKYKSMYVKIDKSQIELT
jgi:cellulose synthase/poly-beta-1,6-N-acetylglucosamine synthase-like glycosyltransferase